jgi:K(+)-stimulated pyrophosphate-energized sodium pump
MGVTTILAAIGFYFAINWLGLDVNVYFASLVGLAVTVLITMITEYYTSTQYRPVQEIADASETGAATNIIAGLAIGLRSTFAPALLIVIAIMGAYYFGS